MSYPTTPELEAYELPRSDDVSIASPQPIAWFSSPYAHHYAPQKQSTMAPSPPSPLRLSFSSDSSVGTSDDEDSASVSSGSSESSAPTTPVTPVSPFTKTHRRASETDYFSQPERKVRFASLPFTPQLTVPYVEPLGQMSPLWRLDEVDESGHESEPEPTLKVTFKAMKEARKLGLPVHLPVVKPIETPKRPSISAAARAPLLRVATLRRNSTVLAKQFTATPIPRRQRPLVTLFACLTLFCVLLVISSVEQTRYQSRVKHLAGIDSTIFKHNVHPAFIRRVLGKAAETGAETPVAPFRLSEQDELAALVSFMTGTVSNTLPPLDETTPLDPQTILPFDIRSPKARSEMDEIVLETWDQHPLLIIGRMRDPVMRQTKKLLGKYRISPAPEFIEVDQREDFEHVESIISKLLKTTTEEPVILLAGTNIGSNKQLYDLHKSGDLAARVARVGVKMAPRLKKAKHAIEEEKAELQRIRGPRKG